MSRLHSKQRRAAWIATSLLILAAPWSLVHASRNITEHRAADPQGSVEIENVSGSVEVVGWDRSEVEVTGSAGNQVERVDVTSSGMLTSIHVQVHSGMSFGNQSDADLVVHVPAKSRVSATLVSANLKISGVQGDVKLQSVSGDIEGEAGGDVRASTVSGEIQLAAHAAKVIELKTISGDIELKGGGGEVEVTTVSGKANLRLATLTRARLKSISGDLSAALALAPDGQLDGESVSGNIELDFAGAPGADFDVQTLSGDIDNCFGPKPVEPRYGPGSRLNFKNGEGNGHVRIASKSGDVKICDKGAHVGQALRKPTSPMVARIELPYVI
jgi:DUF4097 and DUF4098 domain-containing protein YvlB